MSFRIYNRTNTQHVTLHGAHRRLTVILTRTGYIQLSTPALEYLGLKAGDGIVLLQDERFDDYYFGRGDVTRGAFVLSQRGKAAGRLSFDCSGVSDILGKAAIAPPDWKWMRCELFIAQDGLLGIDIKHATYPKRPHGTDTSAALAALKAKRAAAPSAEQAPTTKRRGRPRKEA